MTRMTMPTVGRSAAVSALIMIATALMASPAVAQSETGRPAAVRQTIAGLGGPYPVVMEMDPSLPDHTIYRPEDMPAVSRPMPVVAYGPGGCIDIGNTVPQFLGELASYGFLVVSGGPIVSEADQPSAARSRPQNHTIQMLDTIDWAIAQNDVASSPYAGRIQADRIAVVGHSCGGLQAIAAAADPRITTAIVGNSGVIRGALPGANGGTRLPAYLPATIEDLARLHTPMMYVAGGTSDQAYPGASQDFADIDGVPVFFASADTGHGGTYREPRGGRYGEIMRKWLQWHLQGDAAAAAFFQGTPCGLCNDPQWTVRRKGF